MVYNVAPDVAWNVAHNVLRTEGADLFEDHQPQGLMLTNMPYNGLTGGCFVGVWIESTPPAPYARVTVITKRRASLDPVTGLTETTFHRDFARALVAGR